MRSPRLGENARRRSLPSGRRLARKWRGCERKTRSCESGSISNGKWRTTFDRGITKARCRRRNVLGPSLAPAWQAGQMTSLALALGCAVFFVAPPSDPGEETVANETAQQAALRATDVRAMVATRRWIDGGWHSREEPD